MQINENPKYDNIFLATLTFDEMDVIKLEVLRSQRLTEDVVKDVLESGLINYDYTKRDKGYRFG